MNFFDNFVARLFPKNVIRCKGLCWFKEEPDMCYLFEQAGKQMELKNAGQWYATMPKDELQQMLEREEGLRRDWDEKYGDRMQKLVFIGQKLDKKANVVDAIEVFMAFSKWMQFRAQTDPNITPELLKTFNYYQDLFISDKMNNGFSCEL